MAQLQLPVLLIKDTRPGLIFVAPRGSRVVDADNGKHSKGLVAQATQGTPVLLMRVVQYWRHAHTKPILFELPEVFFIYQPFTSPAEWMVVKVCPLGGGDQSSRALFSGVKNNSCMNGTLSYSGRVSWRMRLCLSVVQK